MAKTFLLSLLGLLPQPLVRLLNQGYALIRTGYSVGVRVLVLDSAGQEVLLIRHTYLRDWYLPGGGVDHGETLEQAAVREAREELGIEVLERPKLIGLYVNRKGLGRDHIGLFLVTRWRKGSAFLATNAEIAAAGAFAVEDLPADVSPASLARIKEYRHGYFAAEAPRIDYWD